MACVCRGCSEGYTRHCSRMALSQRSRYTMITTTIFSPACYSLLKICQIGLSTCRKLLPLSSAQCMLKWAGACALRASQHGDATTGEIASYLYLPSFLPVYSVGEAVSATPSHVQHLMHIYIASLGLRLHAILMTRGLFFFPFWTCLLAGLGSEEEYMQTVVKAASIRGLTAVAGAHCRVCGQLHKGVAG